MGYSESAAISKIESNYLQHSRNKVCVILEDENINWNWDENDLLHFDTLFNNQTPLHKLCEVFNRTPLEIVLTTIDRELKGKIRGGLNVKSTN